MAGSSGTYADALRSMQSQVDVSIGYRRARSWLLPGRDRIGNMTEDDRVRVGATVRALREAQGWTPEKFCEALGIARPTLANIEAGRKRLTPEKAARASKTLRVPLAALLSPAFPDPTSAVLVRNSDSTTIDLGDAGSIEITLNVRLLQLNRADLDAVLGKLGELRELGERIAGRTAGLPS